VKAIEQLQGAITHEMKGAENRKARKHRVPKEEEIKINNQFE
jgi:hypothetical protein